MDVHLRDRSRRSVGTATVDARARPAIVRVAAPDGTVRDAFLDWEKALDDAGRLRSCIACGCQHLYRRRTLPRFAPFALVLAAAGVVVGALGYSSDPVVLAALLALLALDAGVLVLARTELVCYRCGSAFGRVPVARQHRAWDARTAADPACAPEPADGPPPTPPAPRPPLPSDR